MNIPKNIKELKKALPGWHIETMNAQGGRVWIIWCTQPITQGDNTYRATNDNSIQVGVKLTTPNAKRKKEAIAAAYAAAKKIKGTP